MPGTPAWTYRPLTLDDVPALLGWYNDPNIYGLVYTRPFRTFSLDELMIHWKKKLNREQAVYYAICIGERIVGRVGLTRVPPTGDLTEFSILIGPDELCGRGFGTLVTRHMVDVAFADALIKVVRLYVRRDNKRAIRCYEKVGFCHIHSFTQNGVPVVIMQIDRLDWQTMQGRGREFEYERTN